MNSMDKLEKVLEIFVRQGKERGMNFNSNLTLNIFHTSTLVESVAMPKIRHSSSPLQATLKMFQRAYQYLQNYARKEHSRNLKFSF
jgi:hypothetical protein